MLEQVTHAEFIQVLTKEFGDSPAKWAFRCPICGDIATGQDFKEALEANPRTKQDRQVNASEILGQECIGRTLGALKGPAGEWSGRGCDWTAYGLIPGPLRVEMPDGHVASSFPIARREDVDA